jgi:hypothetical protein
MSIFGYLQVLVLKAEFERFTKDMMRSIWIVPRT